MTRKPRRNYSLNIVAQRHVPQPSNAGSESTPILAHGSGRKSNSAGIMKTRILYFTCVLLLLVCAQAQTVPVTPPGTPAQKLSIVEGYGRLPLAFEANQGQTDPQVKFVSRGAGYNLFLTTTEAVLTLHTASKQQHPSPTAKALPPQEEQSAVLHMKLVGANVKTEVSGQNELPGKSNYFIGNDPKKWHTDVRQYAKVRYVNVYPGVDLVYYGNQRELEYDFVLQPGADPSAIRLGIEGASKLRLEGGGLVLSSAGGDVRLRSPQIYQEVNGVRHKVYGRYVIKSKNEVGFRVADYDRKRALVIDPVLSYSTYLGGSGDDRPFAIAVDAAGNAYVTGTTSSPDFPTANPVQSANHGGWDVFVTKVNADGSALIYSTYLGGGGDDSGTSIAVDSTGVYVTGDTNSPNFPTHNPIQPTLHGSRDAFVTKINAEGDALVYSTYLGGRNWETAWGIAVDSAGRAHVRGDTQSTDFPVRNAIQPNLRARVFNCFVFELSADGSALIYSTYWGGSCGEGGVGIGVDSAGNTYLAGYTCSSDFPTVNPIQPSLAGQDDAFVSKFSADGQSVLYSTFIGGSLQDWSEGFTTDSFGNAYLVGLTRSTDFPIANAIQPTNHGGVDAFVTKINAAGNALIYSTYLGGSADDQATGVGVDSTGNAFVSGYTSSTDFPMLNAIQAANHGARDAFLAKIATDGSKLLFSTYLGGSADESYWRDVNVAVDSTGNAYVAGLTRSVDFPITPLAFQQSLKGGADAFVVKIAPGNPVGHVSPSALAFGAQLVNTTGAPKRVSLSNSGDAQMTVTSFGVTGDFAIQTNYCTKGVKPGTHCDVYVAFTPTQPGARSGKLTFVDNATNSPQTVSLNGIGTSTTTTTLTSAPNPSALGQTVKLTAVVIPTYNGTPSGTVTFFDGAASLGTVPLNLGAAQLITSTLSGGSHSLTSSYSGDAVFLPSTSTVVTEVVKQGLATITLGSRPNPSFVNQTVVFTATVGGINGIMPTGSVNFQQGTLVLSTVELVSGIAVYSTAFGTSGTKSITAVYSGDLNYLRKTSSVQKQVVNKYTSHTNVVSSLNPSIYGQTVNLTSHVTSGAPSQPTGTVTFKNGLSSLGTVALVNGFALLTKKNLPAGTLSITATYNGDTLNNKSTSSPTLSQVVSPATTTTTVTSSLNPSVVGQSVTFKATVTSPTVVPVGTVTFTAGTTTLGTVNLAGGKASLITSALSKGTTTVTATYNGTSNITGSSGSVVQTVN